MSRLSTSSFAWRRAASRWAAPILLATAGSAAAIPPPSSMFDIADPAGVQIFNGPQGTPIVSSRSNDTGIPGAAVSVAFGPVAKPGALSGLLQLHDGYASSSRPYPAILPQAVVS